MLIFSSMIIYFSVKEVYREQNISKLIRVTNSNLEEYGILQAVIL
jgi:hypothetical protein